MQSLHPFRGLSVLSDGPRRSAASGLTVAGLAVVVSAAVVRPAHAQTLYALSDAGGGVRTVSKISPAGVVSSVPLNDGGASFIEDLAVDRSGNLYVSYDDNLVRKFDSAGNALAFSLTGGSLNVPIGLAFDASGNLYAANLSGNSISKISPSGVISEFADTAAALPDPFRLAFDAAGDLYVASLGGPAIAKFDPSGNNLAFPPLAGGGLSPFDPLTGLAFDASGALYANNGNYSSLVTINALGEASVFATGDDTFDHLTRDDQGNFYTVGLNDHKIHKFDAQGNAVPFNLTGDSLNTPYAVVFAPAGASAAPEPTSSCLLLSVGLLPAIGIGIRRRKKIRTR